MYCFNWVAALSHRGGQEFGALPLWPLTVTAVFCAKQLFYISFLFYNSVLFYGLFVSSWLGGVEVAVGRTDWAGGEMCCSRHMPRRKWLLLLCLTSSLFFCSRCCYYCLTDSGLLFPLPLHFHLSLKRLLSFFQSDSSPFLFFFSSPGWETGHSCRGTASLSRVALSSALTKTYRHKLPRQLPLRLTTLL